MSGIKPIRLSISWLLFSSSVFALVLSAAPALGQQELDEATALNKQALQLIEAGKYREAIPLEEKVLAIREKFLGMEHPDVAPILWNLGELFGNTGQYQKAEPIYQRSLAVWEKALGPEHPNVARGLNSLAWLYSRTGQYAKAEQYYQRSLAINEKTLGPMHPHAGATLNNLANLYALTGQYAKAEPLYQRGLAIAEMVHGPEHPDVASAINNLAWLYYRTGQYARAEPLYWRSLAIEEKAKGPNHPNVAATLDNLAALYATTGQYTKAEPLMQSALAINEKALGPEHPEVGTNLDGLARLYRAKGQYAKAEALYLRSLAIYEKTLGLEHHDVGAILFGLGGMYVDMGQYEKAEPLYQRGFTIAEKTMGPEHPDVAIARNNMAVLKAVQNEYPAALGSFKKGLAIEDRHIQDVFTVTTEEQKLTFMQSISGGYAACLSLIRQHLRTDREAVRDGLELVLRRKGVIFDAESRAREALQGRLSETARKEWERLTVLRSNLARLLLNKPEQMSTDAYKEKLSSLQQQIEEVEKHLASESALVAKELKQRTITVEAVAKGLPKNTALVEFVKIRDFDFTKGKWAPTSRYLAFILTAAGDVTLVDLGDASALEAKARQALEDIQVSQKRLDRFSLTRSRTSLESLSAAIWVPLEKSLGTAEKIIVSPDGMVNLVPFAALLDGNGRPLVEHLQLAYVTSGRELVGTEGTSLQPGSDLLLAANPTFDKKAPESAGQRASLRSRDFRGAFTPLPGTERESREIPPLVTGENKRKQVLVGEQATESTVKASRSPRILHLATHGFFLTDEEPNLDQGARGSFFQRDSPAQRRAPAKPYENPLVRSGLAFAGANQSATITEGDDGILTALEITGMDLYGTDLVVLSACDTGVGEIKNGEGVFGLRRAFALAGAKNLMMSLWPVSDEITANQMKAFYQNLQKLPPAEALRQAQLETIKELKAKYGGIAPTGLWAPFILQGAQALGQ